MKLDVNVDAAAYQKLPKSFISGDTFKYTFNVPECFPDDFFELGSTTGGPTALSAQLRKVGNRGPKGFIAQLTVEWAKQDDPDNPGNEIDDYTKIVVSYMKDGEPGDTSYWPICPLEFDVLFETTLSNGEVRAYRSKPVLVDMVASVTTKEVLPDWGGEPVNNPTTLTS